MSVENCMGLMGFQHSTAFIYRRNGQEGIQTFDQCKDGDKVEVLTKEGNWVTGTVRCLIKPMVMYRVVLSNKKYVDSDKTFFDFKGHHYTKDGVPYGILENVQDDDVSKKRTYTGVGYAIIEKFRTVVDNSVSTSGTQVGESLYAYSLYDYNNKLIQNGLSLRELERLVESLSKISHEELNRRIYYNELESDGESHHVNVTPCQKWFLSTGHPTLFLREGNMLFDKDKYDSEDPSTSGFTWYVDDITIHRAMEEIPWTIEGVDSFQLKFGFPVGK